MPQSLSKTILHIVFSTKNRHPFIDEKIENKLFKYIGGTCSALGCQPIIIGGHKDHIHICTVLSRSITISELVGKIKRSSSKWIKCQETKYKKFYWQNGYSVFSVSPNKLNSIISYIENQKDHHEKIMFKEECRRFFEEYEIEYDENYVWD